MKICKYDIFLIFIFLIVLSIFSYFAWQDVDIQFLGFTSGDELPQFKQLNNILDGYLNLDLEKMFRIEFYNYGYIYYLLNVLVTAPFNLLEKYEWAIFAPRFLNGIFSILNLWMIYKISNLYISKKQSLFLVIFCLLIPGFWHYGYIFKPDVFQTFFMLCSVYFLYLDSFAYKRYFYLSVIFLGFGIGVAKFQAIMFAPLVCLYVFAPFFKVPSLKSFCLGSWRSIVIIVCLLLIWIVTNPYLLHPAGFLAWKNMFVFNMCSNATNHGLYTCVTLADKIYMFCLYFLCPFFLIIVGYHGLVLCVKKKFNEVWLYVFFAFGISLCYLLFLVNKNWGIYYISTVFLCVTLFVPLLRKYGSFFLISLFCLQICNICIFQSFHLFLKPNQILSENQIQISNKIVKVLQEAIADKKKGGGLEFIRI